ncbi:MAG: PTS sugar transporter subunit IIA [Paracoccaceae bacterium]
MITPGPQTNGPAMNICGAIVPQRIRLNLKARDKAGLLSLIAEDAAASTGLDQGAILATLSKREALGSTGVGNGIALPHAAIAGIESPFGLLVRLDHAIDYGSVDEKLVDIVFLLLTPPNDPTADLSTLSAIARTLRSEDVLTALRQVATETEAQAVWCGAV